MKTIYDELLERVADGEHFHIDFIKRNMKVGKSYLIKDGEYDTERELGAPCCNILEMIENLYRDYKVSTPSEKSECKRRKYFKALSVDELTDEELVVGMPRELAQAKLESFILCKIIDGGFIWTEDLGKWFYVGNDPDLIVLRSWVENK